MPRRGKPCHHEWSGVVVTTFSKAVRVIEHSLIPLKDGAPSRLPAIHSHPSLERGAGAEERTRSASHGENAVGVKGAASVAVS
jgi:hypothetical protein